MEEFRNVREVEPSSISEAKEHKAVLAMQATVACDTEHFDGINDELTRIAANLGAAATMTYEDLIFVNPLEQPYILSEDPEVAKHEALFYRSHRSIDDTLGETIDAISVEDFDTVTASLQKAGELFGSLYRQLKPEAFAVFRPYFRGINGFPGPSGLFTASIPIIDLLSHGGSNISDQEHARLLEDVRRGLYPSHQAGFLEELLEAEDSQADMPDEVRDLVGALLNRFRKVHTGSVRKFVPQALNAGAEGSGGVADVAGYLASKMLDQKGDQHD